MSDGRDTTGTPVAQLAKTCASLPFPRHALNVVCWGIGSGFPTALSMTIRQELHTGPNSTPPLVLLEAMTYILNVAAVKEQVAEQCAQLMACSGFTSTVITPCLSLRPWEPMTSATAGSGSMVMVLPDTKPVTVDDTAYDLTDTTPTPSELIELVRAWTSNLQLMSMSQPFAVLQPKAASTLECVRAINSMRRAAVTGTEGTSRKTVQERVANKQVRYHEMAWATLERELRMLAEGNVLSNLSDADKAQRLKIGTIQSSHHDKALQLRGIDTTDFIRMRASYVNVLKALQVPPSYTCTQNPSVYTLENTADVLRQPGLIEVG